MVGPAREYQAPADMDLFEEWYPVSAWVDERADAERLLQLAAGLNCTHAVLDDYRVHETYQKVMLASGLRWLQFDSHARQPLLADWVLCASPSADPHRYEQLRRRPTTLFLLGPRFAVINSTFKYAHLQARPREGVNRVLVCFGGGDDRGATEQALEALSPLVWRCPSWDVVVGSTNPHRLGIAARLEQPPYRGRCALHVDSHRLHELLAQADLGIIAGGTLSYEACAVGLPTLLLGIADNQAMNLQGWEKLGAGLSIGTLTDLDSCVIGKAFSQLCSQPQRLRDMSMTALSLVDGKGSERVSRELLR